jgi:hypothetical protein
VEQAQEPLDLHPAQPDLARELAVQANLTVECLPAGVAAELPSTSLGAGGVFQRSAAVLAPPWRGQSHQWRVPGSEQVVVQLRAGDAEEVGNVGGGSTTLAQQDRVPVLTCAVGKLLACCSRQGAV